MFVKINPCEITQKILFAKTKINPQDQKKKKKKKKKKKEFQSFFRYFDYHYFINKVVRNKFILLYSVFAKEEF